MDTAEGISNPVETIHDLVAASGRVVLTVPSRTASSAMTLWAVPARTDPIVTTDGCTGLAPRETSVWIAAIRRLVTTTASTASCGRAPCPPFPRTWIVKRSACAVIVPGDTMISPSR